MTPVDIVTQGVAAAGFAKVLVELVKMTSLVEKRNLFPVLALVFAEGCAFLLAAADPDTVFSRSVISITVLVGITATAGAIGITALQTKADRVNDRIDTALKLDPGATPKDVDKALAASDKKDAK